MIARSATALAPLATELDRPWPVVILLTLTAIQFINTFFLPSYQEEEDFEKEQAELS